MPHSKRSRPLPSGQNETVVDTCNDEEIEICRTVENCHLIPILPKCNCKSIKEYDCREPPKDEPQIKAILLKRTAPQLIKNIFNTKHHRQIIEHVLQDQGQEVKEKYKLNTTTNDYENILESWLKLFMLHHLEHHVFARLAPGEHGVSIKAIRDIPQGTRVFENMSGQCPLYHPIDITEDDIIGSPLSIKELLNDFYLQLNTDENNQSVTTKVTYPIPAMGPNMIDMSFFLNHAESGNIRIDNNSGCDMSSYVSSTEIIQGTPLTINYLEFTKKDGSDDVDDNKLKNLVDRMPFLKDLDPFKTLFERKRKELRRK